MTYHTPLKTSEDFYEALRTSRIISQRLTERLQMATNRTDVRVRPYSMTHVFYEQYLSMWVDTAASLAMSIGSIFVVTYLFFGLDLHSASIVAFTITMIVINMLGLMYWWEISLNAISLVNLVVVRVCGPSQVHPFQLRSFFDRLSEFRSNFAPTC